MGAYEEDVEEIDYNQPLEVDTKILNDFSEDDLSHTSVLKDFQTFLSYISEKNGMKLTKANSFIMRRDLLALNEVMSEPEKLKKTVNQPGSKTMRLFYNMGRTLNLFIVNSKNTLKITPRMEIFNKLSPRGQFAILFDAMWNKTRWQKFLSPDSGGRPEWAQEERTEIAYALSDCEAGKNIHIEIGLRGFTWKTAMMN